MYVCNFADVWITFGTVFAIIDIMFLNEFALIPLTKRAKEAQAKKKEAENKQSSETVEESDSDKTDAEGNE